LGTIKESFSIENEIGSQRTKEGALWVQSSPFQGFELASAITGRADVGRSASTFTVRNLGLAFNSNPNVGAITEIAGTLSGI
jgi:hypothetical protein